MLFSLGIGINKTLYDESGPDPGVFEGLLLTGVYGQYGSNSINSYTWLNDDLTYDSTRNSQYSQPVVGTCTLLYESHQLSDFKIMTTGNWYTHNRLVKWNIDGTIDTSFNSGGTYFDNYTQSIDVLSDDSMFVGGNYATYNGVSANNIIKLDKDGNIDFSFNYGTGFNGVVKAIKYDSARSVVWIAGDFTSYNGVSTGNIVGLNLDGSVAYKNPGPGSGDVTNAMYVSDDAIYLGGRWLTWNGATGPYNMVKLTIAPNLPVDTTFKTGLGGGFTMNSEIKGMAYNPRTDELVVAGSFTTLNGVSTNRIASLDLITAASNSSWANLGPNNFIRHVNYVENRDEIVFGGGFTSWTGGGGASRLQGVDATTAAPSSDYSNSVSGNCVQEPFWIIEYNIPTP